MPWHLDCLVRRYVSLWNPITFLCTGRSLVPSQHCTPNDISTHHFGGYDVWICIVNDRDQSWRQVLGEAITIYRLWHQALVNRELIWVMGWRLVVLQWMPSNKKKYELCSTHEQSKMMLVKLESLQLHLALHLACTTHSIVLLLGSNGVVSITSQLLHSNTTSYRSGNNPVPITNASHTHHETCVYILWFGPCSMRPDHLPGSWRNR